MNDEDTEIPLTTNQVVQKQLAEIWRAIEILAASGVVVGAHPTTGAGPTTAHGESGIARLYEVLYGERPGAAGYVTP